MARKSVKTSTRIKRDRFEIESLAKDLLLGEKINFRQVSATKMLGIRNFLLTGNVTRGAQKGGRKDLISQINELVDITNSFRKTKDEIKDLKREPGWKFWKKEAQPDFDKFDKAEKIFKAKGKKREPILRKKRKQGKKLGNLKKKIKDVGKKIQSNEFWVLDASESLDYATGYFSLADVETKSEALKMFKRALKQTDFVGTFNLSHVEKRSVTNETSNASEIIIKSKGKKGYIYRYTFRTPVKNGRPVKGNLGDIFAELGI